MALKKRGLGRGLDALLPKDKAVAIDSGLSEIPIEFIQSGRYQPRTHFAEASIEELSDSIKSQGVMQPIVLRPLSKDRYEIIAGERRWRAAQLAGKEKIPAVVRDVDDESALAMSLIENIQREDLNPLEEARALQRLIDEFQLTHAEIARAVGKSRSAVTNMLRLCSIDSRVAGMLERGDIEMGHARALLTLEGSVQLELANTIVSRGLNVRQTEALIRATDKSTAKELSKDNDPDTKRLEENLGINLGQPVRIQHTASGKGKMIIRYNSLEELDGVLERMGLKQD